MFYPIESPEVAELFDRYRADRGGYVDHATPPPPDPAPQDPWARLLAAALQAHPDTPDR